MGATWSLKALAEKIEGVTETARLFIQKIQEARAKKLTTEKSGCRARSREIRSRELQLNAGARCNGPLRGLAEVGIAEKEELEDRLFPISVYSNEPRASALGTKAGANPPLLPLYHWVSFAGRTLTPPRINPIPPCLKGEREDWGCRGPEIRAWVSVPPETINLHPFLDSLSRG